ncbi:MAG: PQQ-dependent sugar dehydrogenase [Pseudomonadota bacterium]
MRQGFNLKAVRIVALAGMLHIPGCAQIEPRPRLVEPKREIVLDDLKSPWGMAFISANEILITEKEGGLLRADLQSGDRVPVAGLPKDLVDTIRAELPFDNGGLFDVALDPDFETDPWVYLSYSAQSADGLTTKVIRARLVDDALESFETLLVAEPYTESEFFHYGGGLAFGIDGKLYITIGERIFNERDNPAVPIAQDVTDRRGKIYRINPDGSIPQDNPDFGGSAVPGLYAIGIRAAQGITRHPETGELWFSEHGSRQGDEINRLVEGGNYGWPVVTTGGYRNDDYTPPEQGDRVFEAPIWSWPQTVAPAGLAVYSGDDFPEWEGDLFVSGLSRGSFWRFNFEDDRIVSVEELFVDDRVRSRDVAVAQDGALYMLTDTLLRPTTDGGLDYTETPGGQLLRIRSTSK